MSDNLNNSSRTVLNNTLLSVTLIIDVSNEVRFENHRRVHELSPQRYDAGMRGEDKTLNQKKNGKKREKPRMNFNVCRDATRA